MACFLVSMACFLELYMQAFLFLFVVNTLVSMFDMTHMMHGVVPIPSDDNDVYYQIIPPLVFSHDVNGHFIHLTVFILTFSCFINYGIYHHVYTLYVD
jgi:hypothetical protein